jgi:hypothetical protein
LLYQAEALMPPAAPRRLASTVLVVKFRIATAPVPRCEIDVTSTLLPVWRTGFSALARPAAL